MVNSKKPPDVQFKITYNEKDDSITVNITTFTAFVIPFAIYENAYLRAKEKRGDKQIIIPPPGMRIGN